MSNTYFSFHDGRWNGRILDGWQETFSNLDQWLARNSGESIVRFLSREVRRVETNQGVVYVKLLYSGSESSGLKKAVTAVKWFLKPSRALAIFNISNEILRAGFLCPRPLVAARHRTIWGWPTDLFVSEECLDATIAQRLQANPGEETVRALLSATAAELHRFHQAGFVHGDCTPYNLALNAQNKLVLFDNDRTVRSPWLRRRLELRSLAAFGLRLTQLTQSLEPFRFFLNQYAEAAGNAPKSSHRVAADLRQVMNLTRKRLRERGITLP